MGTAPFPDDNPRAISLACLAAIVLLVGQQLHGAAQLSASNDEVAHIGAGYSYLVTGDYRLNPQHPPLVKILAGIPLLFLRPSIVVDGVAWQFAAEWTFGREFLVANDADAILRAARLPMIALSALLAVYAMALATLLYGRRGGLIAVLLVCFCPTVVAHGRYVTMDVPLACFVTGTLFHLLAWLRSGARRSLVFTGVLLGLAMATKFSGVLMLPVVVAGLWLRMRTSPAGFLKSTLAAGALAFLVVWSTYGFGDPRQFFDGMLLVNADHTTGFQWYLDGEFYSGRRLDYFVRALLYKTPLVSLVAIGAGLWRLRTCRAPGVWLVLATGALFLVATTFCADNMGVRYVIPTAVCLYVLAGSLNELAFGRARFLFAATAAGLVGTTLWAHPHQLAFFNTLAGGPQHGHEHLDDSNIDWGEGLKQLKGWMASRGIERVRLLYPWSGNPAAYGITADPVSLADLFIAPTPGVYAISTHSFIRRLTARPAELDGDSFGTIPPADRVGYAFFIFDLRGAGTP